MKNLLPDAFILCCFCPKTESSDFGSWLRPFAAGQLKPWYSSWQLKKCRLTYVFSHFDRIVYSIAWIWGKNGCPTFIVVSTVDCQRPWGLPLDSMGEIISSQCPVSQRANATVDYFANSVRLVHIFIKTFSKT